MRRSSADPSANAVIASAVDKVANFHISINIESIEVTVQSDTVIRALAALAQEHRLAVYRLLVQAGPDGMAAGVIADAVGIPASSMSFHLAQLTHAGLVGHKRQSRSIIYTADFAAMNALMAYLSANCCEGVACGVAAGCSEAKDAA